MNERPTSSGSNDRSKDLEGNMSLTASDSPRVGLQGMTFTNNNQEGGDAVAGDSAPLLPDSSKYLLKDPKLKDILLSDVGVEALLMRLKQSIATTKEMSIYIKKLATIEQEHSAHLKKVSITMNDAFKRPDIKKGTCQDQIINMMRSTDRYGDAGVTFIDTMHKIHDELNELVKSMDRARKATKEVALRHEKTLLDAEREVDKAKAKYDQACEELEKHRTSDPNKSKLGFKNKSEEELHRRMTIAETDYQQKVDNCLRCRKDLVSKLRVGTTHKLQGLILECDNALALQLLRYSNLLETLQLNRGFVITPLKPQNASSTTSNRSMKEMASKIDCELDFYNFVCSIAKTKSVLNRPAASFKKHPALGPASSKPSSNVNHHVPRPLQMQQASPTDRKVSAGSSMSSATTNSSVPAPSMMLSAGTAKTGPVLMKSQGFSGQASTVNTSGTHTVPQNLNSAPPNISKPATPSHTLNNAPASGEIAAPSQGTPKLHKNSSPSVPDPMSNFSSAPAPQPSHQVPQAPPSPQVRAVYDPSQHGLAVYGTPLEDLLDYEEGTVPRVVYQCVQAIDNFGLEVEGIYRIPGNSDQLAAIREEFDIDAAAVDLLRPKEGVNDIHSVASALKQYFLSLPDALLTEEFHQELLAAASIVDEVRRRDSIHAIINKLPDPNYTTLRYLIFHLYRVQERSNVNKMDVTNLGIVWGPVLMGGEHNNVSEIAVESRAIQTILTNAYAIFEAE